VAAFARPRFASGLAARPEAWAYGLSAGCWAALLLAPADPAGPWFCATVPGELARLSFIARAALADLHWAPALWHWLLMIGAMMLPVAAPALRHVAFRSFPARRGRAMALFLLGYGAVWLAVAPIFLAGGLFLHLASASALLPLGLALAAAALWQRGAGKRAALRRCHRTVPLPPAGARADAACLGFGLSHGGACLASCWALMLIPAVAGHQAGLMLLASAIGVAERALPSTRPDRTAAPLGLAAACCLALWSGGFV
jgi:predicted metal-binding membrane protein